MPSPIPGTTIPPSFTEGAPTTLTFAIPAGTYVSGYWSRNYSDASEELSADTIGTSSNTHLAPFPLGDGSGGNIADETVVTANQLVDINASAAGNLTTKYTYNGLGGTQVVNSLTLTIFTSAPGGGLPNMGTDIIGADGCNMAEGYLYATPSGGSADMVVFGKLTDITIKDTIEVKELAGPESFGPVAVGQSGRKVTLTAKYAQIKANQLAMMRGSARTFASGVTTIAAGVNDQPLAFTVHLKTPVDGSGEEYKFYNCVAPDLSRALKLHDWGMNDLTINVYGDLTDGNPRFYDTILPGDQHST